MLTLNRNTHMRQKKNSFVKVKSEHAFPSIPNQLLANRVWVMQRARCQWLPQKGIIRLDSVLSPCPLSYTNKSEICTLSILASVSQGET